jgi:hypothetical protein
LKVYKSTQDPKAINESANAAIEKPFMPNVSADKRFVTKALRATETSIYLLDKTVDRMPHWRANWQRLPILASLLHKGKVRRVIPNYRRRKKA